MDRDLRQTTLFQEAEALYKLFRQPGTGQISDAAEAYASPDGKHAVFAGTIMDKLEGSPATRICLTDLSSGDSRVLTFGPNIDRLPKYSPDGRQIAFLSDRRRAGDFQLYLLDPASGACRATQPVHGWVEYLHWSPDGRQILLGVAGHGADVAGGQGAVTSHRAAAEAPSWMPSVNAGDESYQWRRMWVYELGGDSVRHIEHASNIWEAVWCGDKAIAAVISNGPSEGLWYTATLHLIDVATGASREIYKPRDHLGWPAGSPSGKHLAVVDAICSDRWIVAGDVRLIDTSTGKFRPLDTHGVDVAHVEWRSERQLLLAGHRGFEIVIGVYDVSSHAFKETWRSQGVNIGGRYAVVSGLNKNGDCVLVGESYVRSPEIGVIQDGAYKAVKSFDLGYAQVAAKVIDIVEPVTWKAPDGLEIQGWLLRPKREGVRPLVMIVHGGPVWHSRPVWLGRGTAHALMLLNRGYVVFFPNPRGSTGRGREFVEHVVGDMGGADTYDYLSGLDHLVQKGVADPQRLGVTGGSYGGFMTSWLITQDARFAAAVPVAPVTNNVTEHLISNIPHFVSLFLHDTYTNPTGKYFERSPIMHAYKAKTPTLNICGALDRCTPPEEALQFHNALLENDVKSVLVTYPEEGHGVRKFPAMLDYAARLVGWFEEHLGP